MKPEISIIIPIYNSSAYLKKCLKSVQNQIFKNFEVLLINDGSTDNSLTICNKFSSIDKRFKVFTQKNSGVASARNNGLKKSLGEYICFIDSDDWVETNFCEILFNSIRLDNYDLVMCGFKTYFSNDNILSNSNNLREIINRNRVLDHLKDFKNNTSSIFGNSVCAKLFKKNIIADNNIEFENGLKVGEDLLFVLTYQNYINLALYIPGNKLYTINRSYKESATTSYIPDYWDNIIFVKKKTFDINKDIVKYSDEFKYYQYLRAAAKAIHEEGKLNNGNNFIHRYKKIKELCNKNEVRHYSNNYKLPNEDDKFYQLIRKLIKLNLPLVITIFLTIFYKINLNK